jgi:hypothetical protein
MMEISILSVMPSTMATAMELMVKILLKGGMNQNSDARGCKMIV